jgi:hypothetical protein
MYKACRHIKSSGLRCKSRALAGANFCYFHSMFHSSAAGPETEPPETKPLKLPVLEDLSSIPIAVARISEALIAGRIDVKVSAQLFWGLKLASLAIAGRVDEQPYSILSVTQSEQGDDPAPEETYCVPEDECKTCNDFITCPNSLYEIDEDDEDDEDEDGRHQDEDEASGSAQDKSADTGTVGSDSENFAEAAGVDRDRAEPVAEQSSSEVSGTGDSEGEYAGFIIEDIKNHPDYIAAQKYFDSVCRIAGIDPP